ncbi:hypothetical protein HHI36_003758 [Cryptolaemus montrouzieri]|uniref:Enoyl-CoA hydratase n=1 Tax=Cryptolaemus montrouzieri TaxID=559131 RepID=A0ABD2PEV5_9CUCU
MIYVMMFTKHFRFLKADIFSNEIRRLCSKISTYKELNDGTVVVEKVGEVTTIGINRPEKRNCINSSTSRFLEIAIENFENDSRSYVGIIHGIGGNFCSGEDLEEIANQSSPKTSSMDFSHKIRTKPLVAAVSGYAVGGGLNIVLMCDLTVLEENALLGFYNRRFGLPCSKRQTHRLAATVGLSRALDLILTGRTLTAEEAFQWGLANRIVACGTALGQALQLARSLVKFPQQCLLHDRNILYESVFNINLHDENTNPSTVFHEESTHGAQKFVQMGIGKHGKSYNLKKKHIPDWEKE